MYRLLLIAACVLVACGDDGADAGANRDVGVVDSGSDATGDAGETDGGSVDATTDTGADAGSDTGSATGSDTGTDGGRTLVEDLCARRFGACARDSDCMVSGCAGETCAPESVASTCDCTSPAGTCGCVAGFCGWYN